MTVNVGDVDANADPKVQRQQRQQLERRAALQQYGKGKGKGGKGKGGSRGREEPVDPMDVSAYSDAPRGSWGAGMKREGQLQNNARGAQAGPTDGCGEND